MGDLGTYGCARSSARSHMSPLACTTRSTLEVSAAALCSNPVNDIRSAQELLGHRDLRTPMIYTLVLSRVGLGVGSPADAL
jgi:site-specific recombinase XerC